MHRRVVAKFFRLPLAALLLAGLIAGATVLAQDTAEPSLSDGGADTCLGCHNDESMLVIFRTPHGQQVDPNSPMASLQCESCHGPGGAHTDRTRVGAGHAPVVSFNQGPEADVAGQDAVCMSCHSGDLSLEWHGSIHERNEVSCASCHSVHTPTDLVSSHATQNEVCFDSRKPSSHPLRSDQPARPAAMVCTDCHNPHAASSGAPGQLVRETTNTLCFDCHAEFRGPVIFDHAPVSEDCSLCHEPHGSVHPALLTRRLPLLCQACHSQRGHPSVPFTDASLPGGSPSSMVLDRGCLNCHTQVHGSNHPSGSKLMR